MVEHPRESAPSQHLESAVRSAGGREEIECRIEAEPAQARAFRDVTSPTEAYDLLLDREVVGQVIRDESRLSGMPHGGAQWVLVQRDADYSLATESADEAIAHARSIVASRMAVTGENPSGPGQVRRRGPSSRTAVWLAATLLVAAVLALAVRARAR